MSDWTRIAGITKATELNCVAFDPCQPQHAESGLRNLCQAILAGARLSLQSGRFFRVDRITARAGMERGSLCRGLLS